MAGSQNIPVNSQPGAKSIFKHLVTAEGELWVFRRSPAFIAIMFAVFIACFATLGAVAIFLLIRAGISEAWLGPIIFLLMIFPWELFLFPLTTGRNGDWPWPASSTTLKADRGGGVRFGKRQVCPAGSVQAVWITTARPKVADWQTYLELDGGNFVSVPPHYFGDFELGEHARPLGEELANALGVELKECS
jgi:hypothetical protein